MNNKIFAVDFDGTLYLGRYPGVENDKFNIPLINRIKLLQAQYPGSQWILWTCRNADDLDIAIHSLSRFSIRWDAVNDNVEKCKTDWGNNPRKVFADYYIDDKCLSISQFLENM